jgi:carbonic anhydrase/acetyltransferase-like protein (isoleucine patch superfamily)
MLAFHSFDADHISRLWWVRVATVGATMAVYQLKDSSPTIAGSAYVAPSASIVGNVVLGDHSSVWFGATLRGDNEIISIGRGSNVQDGAVMHTDPGFPLLLGADVSVGHQAMLHGCTVGDGALIGIQAVVLNAAVIGKGCLVGAGAVVTERKIFADGTLILGAPAKVVRELTPEERENLLKIAANYAARAAHYRSHLRPV